MKKSISITEIAVQATNKPEIFEISAEVAIKDGTAKVLGFNITARHKSGASSAIVFGKMSDEIKRRWDLHVECQKVKASRAVKGAVDKVRKEMNTYLNK